MSLHVRNLQKTYRGGEISVLQDLSLSLEDGESLSIVGASGVGKSTLLHCLGLLDEWDSGSIQFGNSVISSEASRLTKQNPSLVDERRSKIGFVFQFHYLMAELTAAENVSIPLRLLKWPEKEALQKSHEILDRVKLAHRLNHRPHELSGGEQQRVAIARALVHNPLLILADEPTGNLDPDTAIRVFEILAEQCDMQKSILIMATHNRDLALRLKRQTQLIKGRLQ